MAVLTAGLGALFLALHQQVLASIASFGEGGAALAPVLQRASLEAFVVLLLVTGVATWWAVLTHRSRRVAQQESNRQTQALNAQALALRREIASHQQTDAQLQQATRAAESANQAKSRYIASISHELRTPLNSIIGYAELVAEDPAVPAHRRQAVEVIRRAGDHLLSLIEGTLDLARIEGGRVSVDPRPMRLVDTLRTLADLFELQASTKALRFVTDFDPGLPEVVRGDEKRLRQVLINVIGNAVKFTQAGEVRLRATHARELAVFEVEDTGPGMTDEELARIFEPFERGRTTAGGSGLGLTIAKMLADLMGGELTVRSRPGEGTCFRLRLFLPALPPGTPVDPVVPFPAAAVATATSADRPLLPLPSTDMMQSPPPNLTVPARSALESLIEPVRLGWLRGVERGLDRLVADAPDTEAYANRLRQMARRFELAALEREIREVLDRAGCTDG
jgi:signal transduction histidine kinase